MAVFQHILFPVDFSERSRLVLPFVRCMAQKFNAKVTLMHTLGVPRGFYGGVDASYPIVIDWDAMKADATDQMEQLTAGEDGFPQKVDAVTVIGDPSAEIVDFAMSNGVDLIMMPTHGYGKFRSLLLGSVTAKVLHDCDCAVWTAAHVESPSLPDHCKSQNVMCAIDSTPEAVRVIGRAVEIADVLKAKLRLIHAVPPVDYAPSAAFDDVFRADIMKIARDTVMKLQQDAGTNLEVCMEMGQVSKVVCAASLHHDADLVVLGRGKIHNALGRLRTHAYTIIREAPCPVLSL